MKQSRQLHNLFSKSVFQYNRNAMLCSHTAVASEYATKVRQHRHACQYRHQSDMVPKQPCFKCACIKIMQNFCVCVCVCVCTCVSNYQANHFALRYTCIQDFHEVKSKAHWNVKMWRKNQTPTQYYCREKKGSHHRAPIYLHLIHDSQLTQGWCMQETQPRSTPNGKAPHN